MNWISVKDHLPEPSSRPYSKYKKPQLYLCHCKDENNIYGGTLMILGYGHFDYMVDYPEDHPEADDDGLVQKFGWHYERDSEGEYDSLIFDMNAKVTHWMPLPDFPEEKP